MDRLSTLDAEFLHLEDGTTHMHIAGVMVFEPPVPDIEDLRRLVESKVHLIHRYRQRIRTVPLELGRPVWVDDPHFNLDYHLRHTALPSPGDDAALCRLVSRLMSQPLDRNRPLWENWLVERLEDGTWAMIAKVHHCMVDGIAGVGLLAALLDFTPDAEMTEPVPWSPQPDPSGPELVLDAWGGALGDLAGWVRRTPGLARDPRKAVRTLAETGGGLFQFARRLRSTPPLSIEGTIGPHRRWAHSSAAIDDVRMIRKVFAGTLNDVVLAAVSGAYRKLLLARDEDADHAVVRTLVPVSVRTADAAGVPDNRVSAMLCELAVHIADPVERLAAVREQMAALKASHMAETGELVTSAGNLAPPMFVGAMSRLSMRLMHQLPQHSVNTVTTNVPGPQVRLFCLGRQMRAYYPYVPITEGVRVGTAILSYNGTLAFGVTGDYDTAPDVGLLADAIPEGIAELRELAEAGT